jgi:hypothetical protein
MPTRVLQNDPQPICEDINLNPFRPIDSRLSKVEECRFLKGHRIAIPPKLLPKSDTGILQVEFYLEVSVCGEA